MRRLAAKPVPVILDPVEAYDRIAPEYTRVSEKRRNYLDAVDQLVIANISTGSRSMLDVGSGDGRRARRIAQARSIKELVLIEPSVAMQRANSSAAGFRTLRAEELSSLDSEFDVITCLWNVLGHIFPAASRARVLYEFARLVSPQGLIFMDVHHRYNLRHYGAVPTAKHFLHDCLRWSETNGDVTVAWDVEGIRCTTRGHVFTDREFRSLVRAAGLKIEERFVVDYSTGACRRWSFAGHLLYVLRPTAQASAPQTS